jgi:hypothetical protein
LLALGAGCGASPARHTRASAPAPVAGPSLARPVSYATGRGPNAIAIAELNGDGKRDLVTANAATVSVIWNAGTGRLGAREDIPGGGESVAVADLNRDGRPDLAVVRARARLLDCRGCGAVSVLLNRGGSFGRGRAYETGADASAVAVGDLDGDGVPDLAVADPAVASGTTRGTSGRRERSPSSAAAATAPSALAGTTRPGPRRCRWRSPT